MKVTQAFYGLQTFADRVGYSYATLKIWRRAKELPEPDVTIDGKPGWSADTMTAFAKTIATKGN